MVFNIESQVITSGSQTNASVVGVLRERNNDPNGISAAVAGIDQNSTGPSEGWGGYFNSARIDTLLARKLRLNSVRITSNYTIPVGVIYVSCYNPSSITVTLPASPLLGLTLYIHRNLPANVTIQASGELSIITNTPQESSINIPATGEHCSESGDCRSVAAL